MEQAFPQGDQGGRIDYDHLAAAYAQHRRVHPKVLRKLVEAAGASGSDPVLEIGCGSGNYIAAVQSATGCRCFGVDPSARMLHAARGQNPEVSFQVGRGEQLPFADSAFGLAFSVDVIHHVAARADFYAEAWRVLRAGGTVGTVTESEDMIRQRLHSHYFPDTIAIELRRYPSIAELTALMRQAGFGDVREEAVEVAVEVSDLQPYRDRAFSSLHHLSDEAFRRGIEQMQRDLPHGPLRAVSRAALLWGTK